MLLASPWLLSALPPFAHTGLLLQAVYLLLAGKGKRLDIHSIILEQFPFTQVLLFSLSVSLNTACIFSELFQLNTISFCSPYFFFLSFFLSIFSMFPLSSLTKLWWPFLHCCPFCNFALRRVLLSPRCVKCSLHLEGNQWYRQTGVLSTPPHQNVFLFDVE